MEETSCLVNFTGIRPSAKSPEAGYSVKNLGKEEKELSLPDKCAIARGETFSARWLTPRGWSLEKHFFPLQPVDPDNTRPRINCPACGKSIPAQSRFCGYCGKGLVLPATEKQCTNKDCGRSIKSSAKYCPYCGKQQ
jgi:hypothetical protein